MWFIFSYCFINSATLAILSVEEVGLTRVLISLYVLVSESLYIT